MIVYATDTLARKSSYAVAVVAAAAACEVSERHMLMLHKITSRLRTNIKLVLRPAVGVLVRKGALRPCFSPAAVILPLSPVAVAVAIAAPSAVAAVAAVAAAAAGATAAAAAAACDVSWRRVWMLYTITSRLLAPIRSLFFCLLSVDWPAKARPNGVSPVTFRHRINSCIVWDQ